MSTAGRWIAMWSPRQLAIAGWVAFVLAAYPGYMSFDSVMQLYEVRSGEYSDVHPPVMTAIWGLLEYVVAGPLPMLLLQSGLFLFGLAAVLRTVLSPRAAAVTAAGVLIFPPVFAAMAVIWPESLMAGALLAGVGCVLQPGRRWRIAAAVVLIVALACRPEAVFAVLPIAVLGTATITGSWWRRAGAAVAIVVGLAGAARLVDHLATVKTTSVWHQRLMVTDIVGTLRRAGLSDDAAIAGALGGLPLAVVEPATVRERLLAQRDALDWWPLVHGERRLFETFDSDDRIAALTAAWRRTIANHVGAYVAHRWTMTRHLLGISGHMMPIHDDFGDHGLLEPLHHRATTSDWQYSFQRIVRAVARTPLFAPWLYLVLAIAGVIVVRRRAVLRALVISGLIHEVAMMVLAPTPEYRFSQWMIASACIAIAAIVVARRAAWRAP